MPKSEVYSFVLNDTEHFLTLLDSLVEDWELAFPKPTLKIFDVHFVMVIASFVFDLRIIYAPGINPSPNHHVQLSTTDQHYCSS
jgi:hypothetical protein